jgi:hypothetical protein
MICQLIYSLKTYMDRFFENAQPSSVEKTTAVDIEVGESVGSHFNVIP